MQFSILIVNARNMHFGLSHVRLGGRPLVKSVKVVMLLVSNTSSVIISTKNNWKTVSGLELASIPGASLFLIPLGLHYFLSLLGPQ